MRITTSLILFFWFSFHVSAQQDTLFWFAAPEVSSGLGDQPIGLTLTSFGQGSNVTISQPANGAFTPIVVALAANASQWVDLTAFITSIENNVPNSALNAGLKITASTPISASYVVGATGNQEIYSLKGSAALGLDFYTPFTKTIATGGTTPTSYSGAYIVATENATTVLITPRTAVTGHPANTTYSVTLNQGQTYYLRDLNSSAATSLSGSIISSNKPVCVTVSEGGLLSSGCISTAGDQITNSQKLGKKYVVQKGSGASEQFIVLATQNNTSVQVVNSSTTSTVINWGETYTVTTSDALSYVETNKPVYLLHTSGNGCNLSQAQLPPMVCSGTDESVFHRYSSDSLELLVYTHAGFETNFAVNGNTSFFAPADFQPIPGTSGQYVAAKKWLDLTSFPANTRISVVNTSAVFGMATRVIESGKSAFAYHSTFTSAPAVAAGNDTTICQNLSLAVNGDVGGGPVFGVWSTNGYGSFQSPTSQLNNVYNPSPLDTLISPIRLVLTSTGECPITKDTLLLTVSTAPIVSAGANQVLCANNAFVDLDGSVVGGSTEGIWSTLGSGSFGGTQTNLQGNYTPGALDLQNGLVDLVLTSTNNGSCLAETDTLQLQFTPAPVVNISQDTIYRCANDPNFPVSGTVSGSTTSGKWITQGTGSFTPNNLSLTATYIPTPQDIALGTMLIFLESTNNGDCIAVRDTLVVVFTPEPTVNAGPNQVLCANDSIVDLSGVIGGGASTGVWSGGAGVFSSTTDLLGTYTPTNGEITAGSVVLTLTSTGNGQCVAVNDAVQINFVAPPNANFTSTGVCLGDTIDFADFSLSGFGTLNGWSWDFDGLGTSAQQNPQFLFPAAGVYNVSLVVSSTSGCSDSTNKPVQVFEIPVADFNYTAGCPNNQIILSFQDASTSNDPLNYWFYDFGTLGSIAAENTTQFYPSSGVYQVTHQVSSINGCEAQVTKPVQILPRPEAGFTFNFNSNLNVGVTYNFVDTSSFGSGYSWNLGNGVTSTVTDPSTIYFDNGSYQIVQYVTNDWGCVDSAKTVIFINNVTDDISLLIPNSISPNGDGKNDVWKLEFINLLFPQAEVTIFNEWGQELFYSEGYDTPWDATYNGEQVPDGNYFYVIKLNSPQKDEVYKGALFVLSKRP